MNAHKLAATLAEDGTLVLEGLPFRAGAVVEVIILESPDAVANSFNQSDKTANLYPLQDKRPYRYDDPFEPAVPAEDWEALQ